MAEAEPTRLLAPDVILLPQSFRQAGYSECRRAGAQGAWPNPAMVTLNHGWGATASSQPPAPAPKLHVPHPERRDAAIQTQTSTPVSLRAKYVFVHSLSARVHLVGGRDAFPLPRELSNHIKGTQQAVHCAKGTGRNKCCTDSQC